MSAVTSSMSVPSVTFVPVFSVKVGGECYAVQIGSHRTGLHREVLDRFLKSRSPSLQVAFIAPACGLDRAS